MFKFYLFSMTAALALAPVTGAVSTKTPQKSEVTRKAGTRVMDSLTFAQMYANRATGKYGNFSWNTSCIGDFTSSVMTIKYWQNDLHSLPITWTKPSSMAYPTIVRYGYTINAGQNQDSASKALDYQDTEKPYLPGGGDGRKQYAVSESTLYSDKDKLVFWLGNSYMASDLEVTGITFEIKIKTAACSITAGEGVSGAFVSSDQNAVTGSASATFDKGAKIYGFVTLKEGYKAMSSWTLVSGTADTTGAVYRVGTKTMGESDISFGTINAATKTKSLSLDKNGGTGSSSTLLTYGQAASLPTPTRKGYVFLGWNTKLDGTGATYRELIDVYTVNAIILGTLDINMLYAQWERLGTEITLSKEGGIGGDTTVYGINNEPMPAATMPTRPGYIFNGYFKEQNGQGKQYYNADGTSANNWDSEDLTATLYASWTIKAEVQNAIDKIDEIEDPVVLTDACKQHIEDARAAYEAVEEGDKVAVSNYDTLVAAEQRFAELEQAKSNAEAADALIDAIGEVEYPTSKAAINSARAAYDNLDADAKSFVEKLAVLEAAEAKYEELKNAAIANVKALIDAIGEVKYPTSKAAIDAARAAYEALDDADKAAIDNLNVLEAAEEMFAQLRLEAIDNVKNLIDGIGEVEFSDASKAKIDEARNAFDALAEADQSDEFVTNYQTLLDAEARYEELLLVDVHNVEGLIDAIGEVAYTTECKEKIDAAREAYEALTPVQKEYVNNYPELTHAEEVYAHVDEVAAKIDNIGEVTLESGEAINGAQEGYDALSEEEKALIPGFHELLVAKTEAYEMMVHDHKVAVTCGIIFGILGGLILLVCGAWAVLLFVKNKWVKAGDKAVRARKFFGLKKNGKDLYLVFPFKFETKEENEVFDSKEEALK